MERYFLEFCNKILSLDDAIRFIGIANEHGILLATAERKGLIPLLNTEETIQYAITAATRQYTRIRWQGILGKIDYTSSHYDKLLRVTIPVTDRSNRLSFVLIFTFDVNSKNFHEVIMERIIPIIRRNTPRLLREKANISSV
ncbi:MAG TPA: hypothetical protein VH796_12490 [Nitrososphaeraceae archaeon]|jgi:hypothetical protein